MVSLDFQDLGIATQGIDVYYPNGTLQGSYLTNETITINESLGDFTFIFHPSKWGIVSDPLAGIKYLMFHADSLFNIFAAILVLAAIFCVAKRFLK